MKIYKFDIESEICCDDCQNVIRNIFNCPVCKQNYAFMSIDSDLTEYDFKIGTTFNCEDCGAKTLFRFRERNRELDLYRLFPNHKSYLARRRYRLSSSRLP